MAALSRNPLLARALVVAVVAMVALGVVALVLVPGSLSTRVVLAVTAWVLATIVAVILLRSAPLGEIGDRSYRQAMDLIQQLDDLSDKLSGGLDPVALAEELMDDAEVALPVERSAIFTRDASGAVSPLRYSTFSSPGAFGGLADFVDNCWRSERPLLRATTAGIPIRTGARTVGVLIVELTHAVDQRTLLRFQESHAPTALQLQTALLFDNVRSRATSDERNRLAREVHDGVAQDVASLGYMVDALAAVLTEESQRESAVALRTAVTKVVAELRASVYDLRNEMRAGQGLGQGVSAFARQIGSRSDLTVHVRLDEGAARLRPDIEAELLRIAQEAMNNARKHSGGQNLWISCTVRPPFAELEIVDDGAGLGRARHDSHGLRIMRERAESIGAQLDVQSLAGSRSGTRLRVRLGSD